MGSQPASERACLLIADISGYSAYLQGVELDHAQDVIADLMTAVVSPLRPHFRLNKLEGDAAFLYSPAEDVNGSLVLDMVEGCYFAFRNRVRSIVRATSCQCGACSLIPRLDLKIIMHQGTIAHQEMLGMDELVGPDVVLVHRLLKNDVEQVTGAVAYALLTDAVVRAAGLEPDMLDMMRYKAEYPDVGHQVGWVHDLDKAWRKEQARRHVYVDPEDSVFTMEHFIPDVPSSLAWEWLTTASKRKLWEDGFEDVVDVNDGRRGVGAETHCIHGDKQITEEVIDWRPPRYVTYKGTMLNGEPFVLTDEVVEQDGGVLIRKNLQPDGAENRQAVVAGVEQVAPIMKTWLPRLAELLLEHWSEAGETAEPDLPVPDEEQRLATTVG